MLISFCSIFPLDLNTSYRCSNILADTPMDSLLSSHHFYRFPVSSNTTFGINPGSWDISFLANPLDKIQKTHLAMPLHNTAGLSRILLCH